MTVARTGVRDDDREKENAGGGQECEYDDRGGNIERAKAKAPEHRSNMAVTRIRSAGIRRDGKRERLALAHRRGQWLAGAVQFEHLLGRRRYPYAERHGRMSLPHQ
jgi:hypothetical protein